jgi:hypothetical protein
MFVASIADGPQRSPLRFDEWHHEYAGMATCAAGAVLHARTLERVGAFVALDDGTQHVYQRVNHDLGIVSPLNVGYRVTLGAVVPVTKLNRWLDAFVNRLLH